MTLCYIISTAALLLGAYAVFFKKSKNGKRLEKLEKETPRAVDGDGEKIDMVLVWKGRVIYQKLKK